MTIALAFPSTALGGTYTVTECDSTRGVPDAPDAQPFDQTAAQRYREENWCFGEQNGGGLLVYHPSDGGAVSSGVAAGFFFDAPDHTQITAVELLASGAQ